MSEAFGHVELALRRDDFSLEIAFDIPARGVIGVYGHSGCGKTSLLRCLAGLERGAAGEIRVNGETWLDARTFLPPAERAIGYVFQDGRLFPHLDVRSNLRYGDARRRGREPVAGFDEVVALLGIEKLLQRKPAALSGGEQQRVAIGRALLGAPRLLLMDEPLANLDRARKQEILPYLERLHAELNIPMLFVTHSFAEVVRLCDHLLMLEDGRVQARGALESVLADLDLADALGDMAGSVLSVESFGWDAVASLSHLQLDGLSIRVPERVMPGPVRLRILASDVSLVVGTPASSSILNVLPATVVEWRPLGEAMAMVRLDLVGHPLLARVSRASVQQLGIGPGSQVHAQIKGAAIRR